MRREHRSRNRYPGRPLFGGAATEELVHHLGHHGIAQRLPADQPAVENRSDEDANGNVHVQVRAQLSPAHGIAKRLATVFHPGHEEVVDELPEFRVAVAGLDQRGYSRRPV